MATRAELVSAYLAYFGRPPDFDGLKFYENVPYADVIANFSKSPESIALFGTTFGAAQINAIYQNLFNRDAEPAGLDYWSGRVNSGALSPAAAALGIMLGAQNADKTSVDNKIAIINLFESKLDTAAEIVGYSGSAAAASARAYIKTVDSTAASVTAATTGADAAVTAAVAAGSTSTGLSFSLTTGSDSLVGTAGADTFIADNTGTATYSAADSINGGAGNDTVKVFLAAGATTLPAGQLTSVESVFVNGGVLTALDVSGASFTGVTNLTVDAPVALGATYTVKQGQSVTLQNFTAAASATTNITQAAGSTATSLDLGLNAWTAATGQTSTVNVNGALVKTLNVAATGAASRVTLAGTSTLTTLKVTGDKGLNLTESAASIETIDASGHTGTGSAGVTIDASGATVAAAFNFKGGTGNDSIKLAAGALASLTAGTQLAGGAGTDKLGTLDTTFSTDAYARINAATDFEALGLNAAIIVDASKLTSIKSFALDTNGAQTISNIATGSTVAVNSNHADAIILSPATGVSDLTLNLGTATGSGITTGSITVGAQTVKIASNGVGGVTNTIGTLVNAENSTYTVTGANNLTINGALTGTTTGTKIDASALTGKLTVTGSAASDVLIGGTGDDTLAGGTLTVGAAASAATAETATMTGAGGLTAGQTYTVAGLTYTSTAVTTQAELLTAFASLAAGATTGAGTATGTYSGTLTGYSTSAVAANVVTFNGVATLGNQTDLADSGTGAAAAAIATTVQGVNAVPAGFSSADTLTGGAGADTFSFQNADLATTAGTISINATITDFVGNLDKIKVLNLGGAGSSTNYLEATTVAADLATLLAAADTALDGTVRVYVGQVGADSYVVTDINGTGLTNLVKLTGVALTGISAADIIA